MICKDQKTWLHLHFRWNYAPLKILVGELCLLSNSEILEDIFVKLNTNSLSTIGQCAEIKNRYFNYTFDRIVPFENFSRQIVYAQ